MVVVALVSEPVVVVAVVVLALVVVAAALVVVGALVVGSSAHTLSVVAFPANRTLAQDFHAVQLC